jgi:hypothetical protein
VSWLFVLQRNRTSLERSGFIPARYCKTSSAPRSRADRRRARTRRGAFDPSDGGNANRFSLSGRWAQTDEGGSSKANFYVIKSSLNLWNNFTYLGLLSHCLAGLNRYGESELRQHSQNWLNDISPTEHPLITGYRSQAQPVRFFL